MTYTLLKSFDNLIATIEKTKFIISQYHFRYQRNFNLDFLIQSLDGMVQSLTGCLESMNGLLQKFMLEQNW